MRRHAAAITMCVVVLGPASAGGAHAAESADPASQLAERYSPLVFVRQQPTACGEGEPFAPAPVESVLGNADVKLVGPDGQVIETAPEASDLFGLGDDNRLDMPGNALNPGCGYEKWWDAMAADMPATTYARVATDPEHPGKVALQFWFWWVFNDWNDKHEGDWEMMQIVFDADDAAGALTVDPELVMFAQHEGGQYLQWDDDRLIRQDEHVAYFASAGSHAGYFSSNRWFGASAQTGFGCDDTRTTLDRLEPQVVLMPSDVDDITSADDPFAWLTFTGRWGEEQPSFNNGPQGPVTKTSWATPISWYEDEGRATAVALPVIGSDVTDFFCVASEKGSLLFLSILDSPLRVALSAAVLVGIVVLGVRRTRWRPSSPVPVRLARRSGQLYVAALRLQWRFRRVYVWIGAVVFASGMLAAGVQWLILRTAPVGNLDDLVDESAVWIVPLALLASAAIVVPVTAFVRVLAAALVSEVDGGDEPTIGRVARRAVGSRAGMATALLVQFVSAFGIAVPFVGPFVVYLLVRWAVATPAAVEDQGLSVRSSFRRSFDLTRRQALRILVTVFVANASLSVIGPLVGALCLVLGVTGLIGANLISTAIGVVLVPWAATVIDLLHSDLTARLGASSPVAADDPATA